MSTNANNYSMGGAAELAVNVATGTSTSYSSNAVVSTFTGNGVAGLMFGEGRDAAQVGLTSSPDLIRAGMGTVTTYGRNSTQIMALNIARSGGAPLSAQLGVERRRKFPGECQQPPGLWPNGQPIFPGGWGGGGGGTGSSSEGARTLGGAAYGIATGLPDESPVGAAGAGAGLGLTLADTALEGGKVIPVLGNFLSAGLGLYDGYQLAKTVARCW